VVRLALFTQHPQGEFGPLPPGSFLQEEAMPKGEDVRRMKCCALAAQAKKLIGAASNAAHEGHWAELQTKILQTFVLMDLAWKVSLDRDGEGETLQALMNIETLSQRFVERVQAASRLPNIFDHIDSKGQAVARK
jgi:hypothetical protein